MHIPSPTSSRPEALGFLMVSAAVVFALCWLYNACRLGKFKKKSSAASPADSRRIRVLLALALCALLGVLAFWTIR